MGKDRLYPRDKSRFSPIESILCGVDEMCVDLTKFIANGSRER
jgi:hypothetical protein